MPVMSMMSVTPTQLTPSQAARSHRSSLRFLSLEAVCLRDQHLYPRHFTLTISTLHRTTGQCHNYTLSIQLAKKIQHVSMIHDVFLTILDTKSHQNTDAKKMSRKHQNDKKKSTSIAFLRTKTRPSLRLEYHLVPLSLFRAAQGIPVGVRGLRPSQASQERSAPDSAEREMTIFSISCRNLHVKMFISSQKRCRKKDF